MTANPALSTCTRRRALEGSAALAGPTGAGRSAGGRPRTSQEDALRKSPGQIRRSAAGSGCRAAAGRVGAVGNVGRASGVSCFVAGPAFSTDPCRDRAATRRRAGSGGLPEGGQWTPRRVKFGTEKRQNLKNQLFERFQRLPIYPLVQEPTPCVIQGLRHTDLPTGFDSSSSSSSISNQNPTSGAIKAPL